MLTEYLFNTRKNQHFFCKVCGVRPFGVGNETPIGKMYGVNIGCLEDVTEEALSRIPITCILLFRASNLTCRNICIRRLLHNRYDFSK